MTKNGNQAASANDLHRARFGAFFPRVFACAHSLTGDEATAREIVVEAFSRAFDGSADLNDDEFSLALFTATRDLCRAAQTRPNVSGRLSSRESELLALVFDARLTRDEIRRVMDTTEQALASTLLRALRKLRSGARAFAAKPSLNLA